MREEMRERNQQYEFERERERETMGVWERGWSIWKLIPKCIYLLSLQNPLFDLVSFVCFWYFYVVGGARHKI